MIGTNTDHLLLTPSMKMAELMNVSPALPGVLTRMGIPSASAKRPWRKSAGARTSTRKPSC